MQMQTAEYGFNCSIIRNDPQLNLIKVALCLSGLVSSRFIVYHYVQCVIFPATFMLISERFMAITVFIFGLPGSGKSAAARHIKSFARQKRFRPRRFRDYPILYKMFQDDQKANYENKRFRSTQDLGYDGFDVLDITVFNEAIQKLHHNIMKRKEFADKSTELLIIEFSRDDYCEALSFFTSLRLNDAHFLFINSDIPTCKARIKARADHPRTRDDCYVSDYVFETYYRRD